METTTATGPILWGELTWEEIGALAAEGTSMAILPVGATEQHGPHLPTGMDTLAATSVAEGVSAQTGVPVLPTIPYGCSLGHTTHWPGTLSLRPETLTRMVVDMAEWIEAAGFTRLLILNGHVTNWAPLRCALETIRHERTEMRVAIRSIWEISDRVKTAYHADVTGFHANRAETALVQALRPDLVHMERAVDEPDRSADHFFSYPVNRESTTGTVGIPSLASPELGKQILEFAITDLSIQVRAAAAELAPLEAPAR